MSWKFAGIILEGRAPQDLLALVPGAEETSQHKTLSEATKCGFTDLALGTFGGHAILITPLLPYDSAFGQGALSPLDEAICAMTKGTTGLVFVLDGVSGTYAFSQFRDGEKLYSRESVAGQALESHGPPPTQQGEGDEESLIFDLISASLGERIESVLWEDRIHLTVYLDPS